MSRSPNHEAQASEVAPPERELTQEEKEDLKQEGDEDCVAWVAKYRSVDLATD